MSGKLNGRKKFEKKPQGVCWNCGEKGHFKDKCPKPTADKKNDSPNKSSAANATIESDSEGKGAFFIKPELSDNGSDIPEPGTMSDLDEEAESDWNTEELSRVDGSECSSPINVDLDSVSNLYA